MTDFDVRRFLGNLELQKGKFVELRELVLKQEGVVDSQDVDALMRILDEKRKIMAEIDECGAALLDGKNRWKEIRETLDPADRAAVERAVDEIGALLKEIVLKEEAARDIIEKRQKNCSGEMNNVWKMKQAHKAYGTERNNDARFVDYEEK